MKVRNSMVRKDTLRIKTIFYNGGVVDIDSISKLFSVGSRWAKIIINRLLFEGVESNGRQLFLLDRSGLRGEKLRMVTHATLLEVFLTARFILLALFIVLGPSLNITVFVIPAIVIASAIFFLYPDMVFRKGKLEMFKRMSAYTGLILLAFDTQYILERSGLSLFVSIFVIAQGLVLLALYNYTRYLYGLGRKIRLRIKLKYKHKSYNAVLKVKEYITVGQLTQFVLKKFMKKDRTNPENYDAKLFRNNTLLILDRSRKLYEYGIQDLNEIIIESPRRRNNYRIQLS